MTTPLHPKSSRGQEDYTRSRDAAMSREGASSLFSQGERVFKPA